MSKSAMGRVPSWPALGIAVAVQLATACWIGSYRVVALWLAAAGVGWFVWLWTRKRSKVLLVLLNALLLSLPIPRGGGGSDASGGGEFEANDSRVDDRRRSGDSAAIVADDTFPGVILFPEPEDHSTLVPPLPFMHNNLFGPRQNDPLSIPFFGSYYLYKRPQTALPKAAKVMRGDPDQKTFRSTDLKPMVMEAHQNLGTFIDLHCCRAIEVAIRNADRYPSSVSLELTLVNTAKPGRPFIVLGPVEVQSRAARTRFGPRVAVTETLSFELPPVPAIESFDEFSVRFILGASRDDHSAAVAIERFVLLPHGR